MAIHLVVRAWTLHAPNGRSLLQYQWIFWESLLLFLWRRGRLMSLEVILNMLGSVCLSRYLMLIMYSAVFRTILHQLSSNCPHVSRIVQTFKGISNEGSDSEWYSTSVVCLTELSIFQRSRQRAHNNAAGSLRRSQINSCINDSMKPCLM